MSTTPNRNGAASTAQLLGGRRVFGRPVIGPIELIREIRIGFPSAALDEVVRRLDSAPIARRLIYTVVGAVSTLYRKRLEGRRLSYGESDRLARLARLAVRAEQVYGSPEAAAHWLGTPNEALDGHRPLELLASDPGAVLVAGLLDRLGHT